MSQFIGFFTAFVNAILVAIERTPIGHRTRYRNEASIKQYELIYAPIYALFSDIHITSSVAILAGDFRTRVNNFVDLLRKKNFRQAIIALFDKRKTKEGAEIEFGGTFPIEAISSIVDHNMAYADTRLVNLVNNAKLSRMDQNALPWDLLTDEEFELFTHIMNNYLRLNQLYIPQ